MKLFVWIIFFFFTYFAIFDIFLVQQHKTYGVFAEKWDFYKWNPALMLHLFSKVLV